MLKSNFFHLYLFPLGRQCNPQLRIYLSDLTQINLKMHSRGRSGSLIPISWSLGGEDSLSGPVFWCQGVVKDLRLSLGRNISHGQSPPAQCPFSSWERKGNVQIFWQHNIKIQHPGIQLVMKTEWKSYQLMFIKYCVFSSLELAVHPIIVLFSGTAAPPAFDMFTEPMCHENWQPLLPCLTQSYLNGKKFKN